MGIEFGDVGMRIFRERQEKIGEYACPCLIDGRKVAEFGARVKHERGGEVDDIFIVFIHDFAMKFVLDIIIVLLENRVPVDIGGADSGTSDAREAFIVR